LALTFVRASLFTFIRRRVSAKVISNKDVADMRDTADTMQIRRVPPNSSAIELFSSPGGDTATNN